MGINFIDTLFIRINPERTRHRVPFDARIGHGLISTKWNGLNLFVIILLLLRIM